MSEGGNRIDLTAIREKLKNARGKTYWRSLEEISETEAFQKFVENEFPANHFDFDGRVGRRNFLKLMGASLALAGLNACTRQPTEKIIPYVNMPEEIIPGKPLFFATAMTLGGYASGILVESHEGRPTKVEGNPDHPASLGATDIFAQASVLELYDPDRAQVIKHYGRISTWEKFLTDLQVKLEPLRFADGAGLRILTETVTSPTLAEQIRSILSDYPLARWHQYEPVTRDHIKEGARRAFGRIVDLQYDFSKADVVLSLDSDFLMNIPGSLRYTRDFTARRKVENGHGDMNRLYAVESTPTLTGAMADHRLPMLASRIPQLAYQVAEKLGAVQNFGLSAESTKTHSELEDLQDWIAALARDLKRHSGSSVIVAGQWQPPEVHLLAHLMNAMLGNFGKTVHVTEPVEAEPVMQTQSIRELSEDMANGAVEVLLVIDGNPVFDAPADLNFAQRMNQVGHRVHLSIYENETSALCHWHIPETHFLETWSDARAYDGTATIMQPLIAPLYRGKSVYEFLDSIDGKAGRSSHDIVHEYWQKQRTGGDFERFWQTSLHDGMVAGTTFSGKTIPVRIEDRRLTIENGSQFSPDEQPGSEHSQDTIELNFRPDPTIWDGRFMNSGWLQELSKPLTKLTWDNAALIGPGLAERLNIRNEDIVELEHKNGTVRAPVWIVPGHTDKSVTLNFGYGRRIVGKVGAKSGVDVYSSRISGALWTVKGARLRKTGKRAELATTQDHHNMENRHLVRSATLREYHENPHFVHEHVHVPSDDMSLYPSWDYDDYSWGMVVDLNSCVGCNACTVACQSENNIPVVGKEEVARGREMQWIRVDRYYAGELDNPETLHQPVMCMHCENAPCEPVCPVGATVHSDEGLNEMVYNRCVGTRYCSNNCPYKVRRFNFFHYAEVESQSLKMLMNPDVTVRTRGVMEKCTYCVQRINSARIEAKKEDRQISDSDMQTACQQVCPADAIVFGNLNDPDSRVNKLKADHRNYGLLAEIGTRPRTSYLAKLRNPNPEIENS